MMMIRFNPANEKISPAVPSQSGVVSAFLEIFIRISNKGRIMGKPKMAIREKLLLVLEAMADIMVNKDANPIPPRK